MFKKSLWPSWTKLQNTKNWSGRSQKGRGSEKCPNDDNVYPSKFCYLGPKEEIYVEKSRLASHVSRIVARYHIIMMYGDWRWEWMSSLWHLFASNRKRCLTSLWIISSSSDLNIVFQVHCNSATVISKPHIYFQDMYNIDTFIANCKTNNYYASQTLNSKFYFLHNSPANFESYAKNHYAKLCKKRVGSPPVM